MAEENHGQMLIQQQPSSQQSHMQPAQAQLQQSQLQQSQLQQSQLQQSQLQQSQLQQSQLQQSQLQQSQLQQSQLQQNQMQQQAQMQQSQIQQSQLQQSQLQQTQIQQSQLQQTQLQQTQMQQQAQLQQPQLQQTQMQQQAQLQQQSQQQTVNATMSIGSSVEQSNMNVSTTVPLNVATVNVSQPQQMQGIQQTVNTSSGTPVQMAVSQLTAQGQALNAGTMMSQSSAPHPTMMHPTMTMAQAPLQQVQVIPSYLQHHLYSPQQPMIFPGNLTLQHAGMGTPTIQNLGGQSLSLQLQAKTTLDPKTSVAQNIQAVNAANKQSLTVNAGTMMTASGQVIGTAQKANFPQQMMTAPGKSTIIHSQSGFAPNNANQTVVIGQLGVLPNQQSIFNHKAIADSQKGKFTFQNQPTALQPKSLYSSTLPVHSSAQVFNGSHLKQISSQPQIITTQAPGTMFSQAHQFVGLQTLPPGISWATPGSLQSTLFGQNPIIIRSQQSDMFIQQSQPQTAMHLPVAAAAQPVPPTSFTSTTAIAPQKHKQVRMRPSTHSVAVGTQTHVSNAATIHSNTAPIRTQIKVKARPSIGLSPGLSPAPIAPQMTNTQTQTNQSPPQTAQQVPQQKSDAGNQTYSRTANTDVKTSILLKDNKLSPPKSQAMVAPSTKIHPPQMAIPPMMDASIATVTSTIVTVSSTTPALITSTVDVNTSISTVNSCSSPIPPSLQTETKTSFPPNKSESDVRKVEEPPQSAGSQQKAKVDGSSAIEHLKPQQPIMKPSLGQVKDKQPPQKAIVKPQVLTHVIDGFVIQEGPEPFPVSRSALLDSPSRDVPSEKLDSQLKRKDSPTVASPDKKLKVHRARGNVELAKCEYCGKLGPKSKFKRSKRFCSNSCAKRFNAEGPKRVGLLPSVVPEHLAAGGPGRKKKMGGYRGRKGLRKQAEMEEEIQIEENLGTPGEDMDLSVKIDDVISQDPVDNVQQIPIEMDKDEVEMEKIEIDPSQKLPTKWTVQDVFDFIRNLPGCSDYADTFKSQEIDGQALLLLKEDHLMTSMCMKLGPALKLISQIRSMKEELGQS